MLLIYPPAARSTEAPLGIAMLASFLRRRGRDARLLDLNQESVEYLAGLDEHGEGAADAWTRGALRRRASSIAVLRDPGNYRYKGAGRDRYDRAVRDLGRAFKALSAPHGTAVSLTDYSEPSRSPLRRADLLDAARHFDGSVYYPLFLRRIDEELAPGGGSADSGSADSGSADDGVVGLSLCYLSQALPAFAILGYLRARHPGLRILVGGGLVNSWFGQGILNQGDTFDGLVDAFLPGRGEESLSACLPRLGTDRARACPDFSGLEPGRYLSPGVVIPYAFSSGCPWRRCTFCPEKAEGLPYRGTPAGRAMGDLAELAALYKPALFHFTDNEVAPLYLRALAESGPGLPWYGFARFSARLLDPGFCRSLAASGCAMLQLGLESGDQRVLDAMDKGTRLEDIDRILENLAAAGIRSYLYVLFGTAAEDEGAARRTAVFLRERAPLVTFLNVAVFNMPRSSPEAQLYGRGGFYEGELGFYVDFDHPGGWQRGRVREFIAREIEGDAGIRTILRRTPAVFSSNHAAFLTRPC